VFFWLVWLWLYLPTFFVKPLTLFVYKKNPTLIKEGLWCPLLSMPCQHINEESSWIASENTQKPLWQKEKHVHYVTITIKSFLHLNCRYHRHLAKKNHPWYQIYSNGVDNDDINHVQMSSTNRTMSTTNKKSKEKVTKECGLFSKDIKPCIFRNGHKNIMNSNMGCSPLPTMGIS